ncbi:winged helix-turn-helix domain-containing protein [Halocatena halophila]|uniref:winged helix-turn-helix domain-containing protein n=1 Tax=Halocatena halophila TaxID=2814576 RepID=UPI002ED23586
MTEQWDEVSFVLASTYRVDVLRRLADGSTTPSQLASESDLSISHVSRALRELRDESLVELLVPEDRKKGRIYGITDNGETVWELIDEQDLA